MVAQQGDNKARANRDRLGVLEWFHMGEHDRVHRVLDELDALGVTMLRTGLSWADWHREGGEAWFDWLLPTLAERVRVLPCAHYTPPSLGIVAKTAAPPREPRRYADFIDHAITRWGDCFDEIELWNEPNNISEWDWTLDPQWMIFCEMIGAAAYWARQRGKRTVLGGLSPTDPGLLTLLGENGVLQHIDAVGIHGFPGIWETAWQGWDFEISRTRDAIRPFAPRAEVWITETGYSTWRRDEQKQVAAFLEAVDADADRVFWYACEDLTPEAPTVDGYHSDEREYHFGVHGADGAPKLLARALAAGGIEEVRGLHRIATRLPRSGRGRRTTLVIGAAGRLGSAIAEAAASEGDRVLAYDSLERPGAEGNIRRLASRFERDVEPHIADLRDLRALRNALRQADVVHCATAPPPHSRDDRVASAGVLVDGVLLLLHELERIADAPPLLFASSTSLYALPGNISVTVRADGDIRPDDAVLAARGLAEDATIVPRGAFACALLAAERFVLDAARNSVRAAALRVGELVGSPYDREEAPDSAMALAQRAVWGDPSCRRRARDLLVAADAGDAFLAAAERIDLLRGHAWNVCGGPSLVKNDAQICAIASDGSMEAPPNHGAAKWLVASPDAFRRVTGWRPVRSVDGAIRSAASAAQVLRAPSAGGADSPRRVRRFASPEGVQG